MPGLGSQSHSLALEAARILCTGFARRRSKLWGLHVVTCKQLGVHDEAREPGSCLLLGDILPLPCSPEITMTLLTLAKLGCSVSLSPERLSSLENG